MDGLFKQLYKIFQIKQQAERQFEKVLTQQGLDSLKFEMMKIQLQYDSLPVHLRGYIDSLTADGFKNLLSEQRDNIKMRIASQETDTSSPVDMSWVGTR